MNCFYGSELQYLKEKGYFLALKQHHILCTHKI